MSTSNSNVPLGECVVCGQETATRCSKCAQGGVEWTFFCSRDHQRAIWNVHKRACGSPFRWPAINSKEKDEILELSPKSYREHTGEYQTWLTQFDYTMEEQEVRERIVERRMITEDDPHPSTLMMVCNYRYTGFKIKYALIDPMRRGIEHDKFNELIASDPLGFLAFALYVSCPTVEGDPKACWYSDFHHRMLCFIGVLVSRTSTAATLTQFTREERRAYADYTIIQASTVARTAIQQWDPTVAKSIDDYLFPAMFQRIGT